MDKICFLIILCYTLPIITDAAECDDGWTPFKDEVCIVASTGVFTYNEAKAYCLSKGNNTSPASLVAVKEADLQEFLADFTQDTYDNLWLGGKHDNESNQFRWEDGDPLTYTNWGEGFPRNNSNTEACIQLRPVNAKLVNDLEGKWEDTSCQRRNLALCQTIRPWSLEDAVRGILSLRKELEHTKQSLELTNDQLTATTEELKAVTERVVPVGSLYIEYFNQSSPEDLWPTLTWQDITVSYAGRFFRALGGNSEAWGINQEGCAPRLNEIQYYRLDSEASHGIRLPEDGWSPDLTIGIQPSVSGRFNLLKFNTQGCEVRPTNQAIKIWKRIA